MDQVVISFEAANMVVNGIVATAGLGGFSLLSFGSYMLMRRHKPNGPEQNAPPVPTLAR